MSKINVRQIAARDLAHRGKVLSFDPITGLANPVLVTEALLDPAIRSILSSQGAVYVTQISSANISNLVTSSKGEVVDSFRADSFTFTVHVTAQGGSDYLPEATVNGLAITNFSLEGSGPEWQGSRSVTVSETTGTISVIHADGPTTSIAYEVVVAPEIQTAVFTGGYPGSQTELKAGDTFSIQFTSDVAMTGVEIQNYGAATSIQTSSFASGTSATASFTVGNRGVTPSIQGLQLRVHDADNSYGSVFTITPAGGDGINQVTLNNVIPTISFGSPTYPASQGALKDSESATLTVTVNNANGTPTLYASTELNVASLVDSSPSSIARISGSYRVSGTNISATAYRSSNGTQNSANGLVNIAHTAPVITVTEPSRLLSSPSGYDSTITISSTQQLIQAPTLVSGTGTFQGGSFGGGPSSWTRSLRISDSDPNGTPTWGALNAVNLAGKTVTTISGNADYVVGGFISRRIVFPAFGNDVVIGTTVADTAKLSAVAIGGVSFSYVANTTDNPGGFTYTITGGDTLHVNDSNWVNQNGTGSAYIDVSEEI